MIANENWIICLYIMYCPENKVLRSNNHCEGSGQPVVLNVYKYLDLNINQSRLNFNIDRACIIIE